MNLAKIRSVRRQLLTRWTLGSVNFVRMICRKINCG